MRIIVEIRQGKVCGVWCNHPNPYDVDVDVADYDEADSNDIEAVRCKLLNDDINNDLGMTRYYNQ